MEANNGIDPYEQSLKTKYTTDSRYMTMAIFTPNSVNLTKNGLLPESFALTPNYLKDINIMD